MGMGEFFLQLRSFLETSSREIETASEDYSYFVLERLHIATTQRLKGLIRLVLFFFNFCCCTTSVLVGSNNVAFGLVDEVAVDAGKSLANAALWV